MNKNYQIIKKKLRDQLHVCRDRSIRVKAELIILALKLDNVKEACARRGFSRKFYYKWWGRLKRGRYQLHSLREISRRPRFSPTQIAWQLEKKIRYLNRRGYGSRMISAMLKVEGQKVSPSTVCHVLNQRRKIRRKRKETIKAHRRRYELVIPGQRLQVDVKYVPELVAGKRLYSYVAVDECTRWRFARAYSEINQYKTRDFLEELKKKIPFPIQCLQTDNGQEFTFRLMGHIHGQGRVIHQMDQWCDENNIRHRCIPPGEKELNGKVERSHRTDEQYFYWRAPKDNEENFNRALDDWIYFYNYKRLHGGIGYTTPISKLKERFTTLYLGKEEVPQELHEIKLKFLKETTLSKLEGPRSRLSFEQRLEAYLKSAA